MCDISVIVPVYKTEQYLERCLSSILNNTFKDIEVLVIDDGSPNGGACDVYSKLDNRVRVIHCPHRGLSAVRNEGIRQASAPIISFVDSDDWVHPEKYMAMYRIMQEYDADLVSCGFQEIVMDAHKNRLAPESAESRESLTMSGKAALEKMLLSDKSVTHTAWGKLYKKELFENVYYPEGRIFEDAATTYKLYFRSGTVTVIPDKYYNYLIRRESITDRPFNQSTMDKLKAAEEIEDFVSKNCPELKSHALCFSIVTMLRMATGFSKEIIEQYPEEYSIIDAKLRKDRINDLLSARHKCLLFLYRYCRPLFRAAWNKRLRKPVCL